VRLSVASCGVPETPPLLTVGRHALSIGTAAVDILLGVCKSHDPQGNDGEASRASKSAIWRYPR